MRPGGTGVDVDRLMAYARALAHPRYPGSDGDRRAIAWLADAFRARGLEVAVEDFTYSVAPAFAALRGLLVSCAALVGGAGLLAPGAPLLAGGLVLAALAAAGVFLAWTPGLERIYRGAGPTRTANVEGRRRAVRRRGTLILLAHHDSKSQNLTLPARAGLTLLALGGTLALAVLLIATALAGSSPSPLGSALAGGLGAAAMLGLATLKSGNRSPGGVDNAGSVAIVLELARLLPAVVDPELELVFLSPGAEEDHMVGAMRWLDAHRDELAAFPAYALNIDGAGAAGRLVLLERYGFGRLFSATLSAAAGRAAGRLGLALRRVLLPPAMGVDAIPFVHRGVECVTLASGSLGRAVLAVHSAGDRWQNLDPPTLERAAVLALEIALEVASGPLAAPPAAG